MSIDAVKTESSEGCDDEAEPMWGQSALNGRIFITHVLLLASVVTSWLLWLNDDQKLKNIGDGDKTDYPKCDPYFNSFHFVPTCVWTIHD